MFNDIKNTNKTIFIYCERDECQYVEQTIFNPLQAYLRLKTGITDREIFSMQRGNDNANASIINELNDHVENSVAVVVILSNSFVNDLLCTFLFQSIIIDMKRVVSCAIDDLREESLPSAIKPYYRRYRKLRWKRNDDIPVKVVEELCKENAVLCFKQQPI